MATLLTFGTEQAKKDFGLGAPIGGTINLAKPLITTSRTGVQRVEKLATRSKDSRPTLRPSRLDPTKPSEQGGGSFDTQLKLIERAAFRRQSHVTARPFGKIKLQQTKAGFEAELKAKGIDMSGQKLATTKAAAAIKAYEAAAKVAIAARAASIQALAVLKSITGK